MTVSVGSKNDIGIWRLPKKLLTRYSPFFAAALDGHFSEAESNSITLLDDNPQVFKFFVQWLYCGDDEGIMDFDTIIDVESWGFGDKILCHGFQNFVMSRLLQYHERNWLEPITLRLAYEECTAGSKLRQFVLDLFRYECVKYDTLRKQDGVWVSTIKEVTDFGSDFTRSYLDCPDKNVLDPAAHPLTYMFESHATKTTDRQGGK